MYSLKPYFPVKSDDLIRVGRNRDGGYVINKRVIDKTKYLIGLGISTDWSFEKSFKKKNKNIKIFAFDFSVSLKDYINMAGKSIVNIFKKKEYKIRKSIPEKLKVFLYPIFYIKTAVAFKLFFNNLNKNFFFKKGIDKVNDGIFITANEMFIKIFKNKLPERDSVFLKIDIETSEYAVLPDLNKHIDCINAMVIEFHKLKQNWALFTELMNAIREDFVVAHIHGNNFASYIANTQTPDCIELTVVKKSLFTPQELNAVNAHAYPIPKLDYPCNRNNPDLVLNFN